MNVRRSRVRVGIVKFNVRINKAKMKFVNRSEQNNTDEIFRNIKVIYRMPRPVYELEELKGTLKEERFCGDELTPLRVNKRSVHKIHKILNKQYWNSIL